QQLFEHQTIAAIATAAIAAGDTTSEGRPEGPGGNVPLTPIQRWFFELALPSPHHWNQALLVETPPDLDRAALAGAVAAVVSHHDAFGLRFTREGGEWRQAYAPDSGSVALDIVDANAWAERDRSNHITTHAAETQRSLDLSRGPLARFVLYDFGPAAAG